MNARATVMAKAGQVGRKWYVVDADGKTLGRLASEVAKILRGKHKAIYTPHVDTGDHVIIINAEKIVLTGKKLDQKMYTRHTGYPGGLRQVPYRKLIQDKPEFLVYKAVKGMIPHTKLGRQMITKLKVYSGSEHPHSAQQPKASEIKG